MTVSTSKNRKIQGSDWLFLGAAACVVLFYLWKLKLGNADIDETFYLSIPYRMVKGDSLIVHEWHVSQLWSFLLYPVMKLYLMFHSETEGIVLTFRYIFLVFHMAVMCTAYGLLRKRYKMSAAAAAICYGIFVPYDIMALNYNSMGLSMVFLLAVRNLDGPPKFRRHAVNGILIAGMVLCNPYTVGLYLLYAGYMLVKRDWKGLIYTHAGILLLAVPFLISVLSRASIGELLVNFPHVLSNPSHPHKSVTAFLKPMLVFARDYLVYVLAFLLFWFMAVVDQRRRKLWIWGLLLTTVLMTLWFALFSTRGLGMNAIMLPLTPLGFAVFSVTERKNAGILWAGLIFPVLYAMCMNLSSNQGMYVMADACAVSSCITLLLCRSWLQDQKIPCREAVAMLTLLVICQAGSEIYVKRNHVFWEGDISALTAEITAGPLKGIRTTEEKKEAYEQLMQEIGSLDVSEEEHILFYEIMPCGYLAVDARFGTFSAWSEAEDGMESEKFVKYYELHPDRMPDLIYAQADSYEQWGQENWEEYCQKNGYTITRSGLGNYILRR